MNGMKQEDFYLSIMWPACCYTILTVFFLSYVHVLKYYNLITVRRIDVAKGKVAKSSKSSKRKAKEAMELRRNIIKCNSPLNTKVWGEYFRYSRENIKSLL